MCPPGRAQPQFPPAWKRTFPDTPLSYQSWGFERLGEFLDAYPSAVTRTPVARAGPRRENTLTLPGAPVPDLTKEKPAKEPKAGATNGAPPADSKGAVAAGVAAAVAAKAGGSAEAVAAFLEQEQFKFTIDSLARAFAAFSALPARAFAPVSPRGRTGSRIRAVVSSLLAHVPGPRLCVVCPDFSGLTCALRGRQAHGPAQEDGAQGGCC